MMGRCSTILPDYLVDDALCGVGAADVDEEDGK